MGAATLIDKAFVTTCAQMTLLAGCATSPCKDLCDNKFEGKNSSEAKVEREKCYTSCGESGDSIFSEEICLRDLKIEGGCECPTDKVADCNCEGSALEELSRWWSLACQGLGALGLVGAVLFTGIPAIYAGWRHNRVVNACCYSVCSGMFSTIFIGCGVAFLLLGFAVETQKDSLMSECTSEIKNAMNDDGGSDKPDDADAEKMADEIMDCGLRAFCKGVDVVVTEIGITAIMIGVPYVVAGITMFAGCYVACCCKESIPQPDNAVKPDGKEMVPIAVAVAVDDG
eukprot:CAMPEP_0179423622 /NCGR_PEP_ID=MMETSP0799-20121207/11118_1 /TAXON_ID=46947 /ORGANISM="Geminigera cryophila, Strain CCMP2564" /LENGTH=284 /DNA_ID=CAMNT_0021197949 /DNA_START=201 /DNA_END=1055 /DNA_ORIENTATION=-